MSQTPEFYLFSCLFIVILLNIMIFLRDLYEAKIFIRAKREVLASIISSEQTTDSINLMLDRQFKELDIAECSLYDSDLATALQLKLDEDTDTETETDGEWQGKWIANRDLASGPVKKERATPPANRTCLRCTDETPRQQSFKSPCTHDFCFDCLADFFEATIRDEALYPPKCCGQEIPFESVQRLLDDKLCLRYTEKKMEYDTEPNRRTYCHNTKCGSFIFADLIEEDVGLCLDCGRSTCTMCKRATHRGDCPSDEDTQKLLELAENKGWQRCYNAKCHRVVERASGCNHMTCPCGAQFCYICGARWKTCTCPQFNNSDQPAAVHRLYRPN